MSKNFGLIGLAGYIAPRHMRAIKETNNVLVAGYDPKDSVGIVDSYFPELDFFTEFERFDRHVDKLRRKKDMNQLHFMTICSPNYLHDSHARFALRSGCDVICEKPLVLNPWNIEGLASIEKETGKNIFTILQLRLHPAVKNLKEKLSQSGSKKKMDVDLAYITSRGSWYLQSWKGDVKKSGGIATNIGVHFFDMLFHLFGDVQKSEVHLNSESKAAGFIEYENARVRWFLSIDYNDIPADVKAKGSRTYRSIVIDGQEFEFSEGFTDLHTESYRQILAGRGFRLDENKSAINTVAEIRNSPALGLVGEYHPFLKAIRF